MVEKTIKIKKRGGGTRLQRVKVLASGKFRFIKNKTKSARKTIAKRRKSSKRSRKSQPIRRTKRTKRTVAKKRRFSKARGGISKITGNKFVRGAVLGLGGGALAIQVSNRFFPQASGVAGPIGAFVMGGPIGLVASLFLQGGLGGLFSGGSAGNGGGNSV